MTRGVCALTLVCFAGLLGWAGNAPAPADLPAAVPDVKPIAITPSDGFNLAVVDQPDDHYVVVKLTSAAHNWFAAKFVDLPTDAPTTIGLNMTGNDTKGNKADVKKWTGLVPVLSYADPTKYESYECFEKGEDGLWRSTDVLKPEKEREAGTGKCPDQAAIPKDLAEEFLSKDGKSWEPWREVEKAEAVTAHNVFRITHWFRQATATVAMRVPYTYTYQQALVERIRTARLPGVEVDDIGVTPGGRKVQVIRVSPPDVDVRVGPPALRGDGFPFPNVQVMPKHAVAAGPSIMVETAREHATEHASSWSIVGMLERLASGVPETEALRRNTVWLLIPLQDPDGSADSTFDKQTEKCHVQYRKPPEEWEWAPPEIIAYVGYFRAFAEAGFVYAASVGWHNVECAEGKPLFCAFIHSADAEAGLELNTKWFAALQADRMPVDSPLPKTYGRFPLRLFGWVRASYGAVSMAYEVGDRYPGWRMRLTAVKSVGASHVDHLIAAQTSEPWQERLQRARAFLLHRAERQADYAKRWGHRPFSMYELLAEGI